MAWATSRAPCAARWKRWMRSTQAESRVTRQPVTDLSAPCARPRRCRSAPRARPGAGANVHALVAGMARFGSRRHYRRRSKMPRHTGSRRFVAEIVIGFHHSNRCAIHIEPVPMTTSVPNWLASRRGCCPSNLKVPAQARLWSKRTLRQRPSSFPARCGVGGEDPI